MYNLITRVLIAGCGRNEIMKLRARISDLVSGWIFTAQETELYDAYVRGGPRLVARYVWWNARRLCAWHLDGYSKKKYNCQFQTVWFGANYEDGICIDGYMWDLDSNEGESHYLTSGGDDECPVCRGRGWVGARTFKRNNNGRLPTEDDLYNEGE